MANVSLKELNESIWPTVIGEALVTAEGNSSWVDLQDGGPMIQYLSEISTFEKYVEVCEDIKAAIKVNKTNETGDPEVVARYIKTLSEDDAAYKAINKIFKKKQLVSILKHSGTRKRNIFCWLTATLLLEYLPGAAV